MLRNWAGNALEILQLRCVIPVKLAAIQLDLQVPFCADCVIPSFTWEIL